MAGAQLGERGRLLLPFLENRKKSPNFRKKGTDCVHHYVKFFIRNLVLNVYQNALVPRILPWLEKFLVVRLHVEIVIKAMS